MTGIVGFITRCSCGVVSKTASGLPAINWRRIDGKWYCGDCAKKMEGNK